MLFGGNSIDPLPLGDTPYFELPANLALIPTSVSPAWWQIFGLVVLVAAAGMLTGALASRQLVASPLGVSRRARRPAPRPWGLLLVGTGLGGTMAAAGRPSLDQGQALLMGGILLVVLGVLSLGPWVAFRSGQRAARGTSDPATLIAAGHLVSDPRPAGRAAAAVGAIGLASGVAAVMEVDAFFSSTFIDRFTVISFALVGAALLLVLLVTASSLAVQAAESLVDRRRVLAVLAAAGTPVSVLRDALRREAMLTALPLSVGGALIGAVAAGPVGLLSADSTGMPVVNLAGVLLVCGQVAVTIGLIWAVIRIAIGAVAPRLLQVTAPVNLRTEQP
jgi:hypothetical protein